MFGKFNKYSKPIQSLVLVLSCGVMMGQGCPTNGITSSPAPQVVSVYLAGEYASMENVNITLDTVNLGSVSPEYPIFHPTDTGFHTLKIVTAYIPTTATQTFHLSADSSYSDTVRLDDANLTVFSSSGWIAKGVIFNVAGDKGILGQVQPGNEMSFRMAPSANTLLHFISTDGKYQKSASIALPYSSSKSVTIPYP